MISQLTTYLKFGTYFCGIEHTSKRNENVIFSTLIKKSKNKLDIEKTFETDSIKTIVEKLPKKQHAALVINDNNVLTKCIESEKKVDLQILYKAFPNIVIEDFYFEILHQNNIHFVSICRKDVIEALIESYNNENISIIDISLGNNLAERLIDFSDSETIETSNASISISNKTIRSINKRESLEAKIFNINGLDLTNEKLLSFLRALQCVLNNSSTSTNFETKKKTLLNDYQHSRFFSLFLKIGGLFILGSLLINFFVFQHYFNGVNELSQISQINKVSKSTLIKLNEEVGKKQKMVDDLLKSNTSQSSFYINSIVHRLPSTILLSEFDYQPLEKRIKSKEPIQLQNNSIIISGTSVKSDSFSSWISDLELLNWISKIVIIDYGSIKDKGSDFKLKISISSDQ